MRFNRSVPPINVEYIPTVNPPPYCKFDPSTPGLKVPPAIPRRNNSFERRQPQVPPRAPSLNSINSANSAEYLPKVPSRPHISTLYIEDNSSHAPPPLPERSSSRNSNDNLPRTSVDVVPPIPMRPSQLDTNLQINRSDRTANGLVTSISCQMSGMTLSNNDIFETKLSTKAPLNIFTETEHPVQIPNLNPKQNPVETNKFYGNMLLGSQTLPVWTHPYSVWYSKDIESLGLAVSYIKSSEKVLGPGSIPQYYFSPVGIKSVVFSASEFLDPFNMNITINDPKHMSAQVNIGISDTQYMWTPLIQGMGFVSTVYYNMTPRLISAIGIQLLTQLPSYRYGIQKFHMLLENGVTWTLYISNSQGVPLVFNMINGHTYASTTRVLQCLIQIVASNSPELDSAAGCFPVGCQLSSKKSDINYDYSFEYELNGLSNSGGTLLYALPHHVDTFTENMSKQQINSQLDSTVCGTMNAYITNRFEMKVAQPTNLNFQPFTTLPGREGPKFSSEQLSKIRTAAATEVEGDVISESNLDSMYFAGKMLAKYAWILYCCRYILNDDDLVDKLMPKLQTAMKRFSSNTQILPLRYDTTWKGLISSGIESQDFGNSYYNDHHFHYSYHIIAAAIITKIDQEYGPNTWLAENSEWVESLIRDYSNPSVEDKYFPAFRSFDWYNGHSWAKGLFESGDGKDQESSSEDVNASYALKLWGLVTGDNNLVAIGNLQLGILKSSINHYFLFEDSNNTVPTPFKANKVSGILFENKVDHTTYFGNLLQYIQMIHAIPITPASSFVRSPQFVKEEWVQKLRPIVNDVDDGWKGIIMLNTALFDPALAYSFFSDNNFKRKHLDDGQSLTWSLTYSAAFS